MAKTQTRRSVSMSGDTYRQLRAHCDEHKTTMSGTVEQLVLDFLAVPELLSDARKDRIRACAQARR